MRFNSAPGSGLGNESIKKIPPPQETDKEILQGYVDLAEQSKKERDVEAALPRLSKAEEMRIRDQIEEFRSLVQKNINQENEIRDRSVLAGDEDFLISLYQKTRVANEAEISRLERELRKASPNN